MVAIYQKFQSTKIKDDLCYLNGKIALKVLFNHRLKASKLLITGVIKLGLLS